MNNNLNELNLYGHRVDLEKYEFDGARGIQQFFANLNYLNIHYHLDEDKFVQRNRHVDNEWYAKYLIDKTYITVLVKKDNADIVDIGRLTFYLKSQLNEDGVPPYQSCIKRCPVCHTIFSDYNDNTLCDGCRDDQNKSIGHYHDHNGHLGHCYDDNNNAIAFDSKTFKGYGFELETENLKGADTETYYSNKLFDLLNEHAYGEHDGSLRNGIEIISYPHTKKALFSYDFKKIFDTLIADGFTSYKSGRCGLHIHASRLLFGDTPDEQDENISKILFFLYYKWDDFVKFSRRRSFNYCAKPFRSYVSVDETLVTNSVKLKRVGRGALNINNTSTVEFRLPRGSLNYNTWRASIDFYDALIRNSKKISWDNIYDIDKWLDGVEDNTKVYMTKRHMWTDKPAGTVRGDK